jgi:hypothetical protein
VRAYLCKQYSPDWWALRAGIPTASSFDRIITGKGKPSASARGLLKELVNDKFNQTPNAFSERGRIGTAAMEAGRASEPEARAVYAMLRNVNVHQVGYVPSKCGMFGCSPDGLVNPKSYAHGRYRDGRRWLDCNADGLLELKCPMPETHAKYLQKGVLPNEYRPQVHGQLVVTELPWVDFMSYAHGYDPLLIRVTPDDYTQAVREALLAFVVKLQEAVDTYLLQEAL